MPGQLVLAAADRLMGGRREDSLLPVDQGAKRNRVEVIGLLEEADRSLELGER